MKHPDTLIAATDLSAPSRHAVTRATMLARDTGARLELLHVVEISALDKLRSVMKEQGEDVIEKLLAEARTNLAALAVTVGESAGIVISTRVAVGPLLQEISSQADALNAGLLVLGGRGSGYMRHMLLGSTAERMLRKTMRPMLVVQQMPQLAYRRVLLPLDFSPISSEIIRQARKYAPGAELIIFNAYEVPFEGRLQYAGVEVEVISQYRENIRQEALQAMRRLAHEAGLAEGEYFIEARHGEASTRILEQVQEQDIDLIVMGKHGTGMTEELLLGSTTKYVLAESQSDVLVIPSEGTVVRE